LAASTAVAKKTATAGHRRKRSFSTVPLMLPISNSSCYTN